MARLLSLKRMVQPLSLCQDKLFLVHNISSGNDFDFQDDENATELISKRKVVHQESFETAGEAQYTNGLFTGAHVVTILLGEEKNCKSKPTKLELTQLPQEYNVMKCSPRGGLLAVYVTGGVRWSFIL